PVRRIAFLQSKNVAVEGVRSGILSVVQADKTKESILEHWKAGSKSKLIATSDSFFCSRCKDVVGSVQGAVVVIPVDIAVQTIRARLRLHQDHRAVTTAKLRREVVGDDLKLFNRRQRCALAVLVLGRVVVVDAIDLECRAARAGAVKV